MGISAPAWGQAAPGLGVEEPQLGGGSQQEIFWGSLTPLRFSEVPVIFAMQLGVWLNIPSKKHPLKTKHPSNLPWGFSISLYMYSCKIYNVSLYITGIYIHYS